MQIFHIRGIKQVFFVTCLFYLAYRPQRYPRDAVCLNVVFKDGMIFHCMYMPLLFIHSSVDGHLGCFHPWLFRIKLFWTLAFHYFRYISRTRIAELWDISVFNFLRNCHNQWHHFTFPALDNISNFFTSLPTCYFFNLIFGK